MDRSTSKHGPRLDDELKKEVEGQLRSGRPTRAEEWHDPEPIEDETSPEVQEEIERRRERERGRTAGQPPQTSPQTPAQTPAQTSPQTPAQTSPQTPARSAQDGERDR